jgi:hypothetical protein
LTVVGVISDTHGLLRSAALEYLDGCDLIVHAGDIGKAEVIDTLQALAPVRAIRGNVDRGVWAQHFPETDALEIEAVRLYLLHDLNTLDLDPVAAGFDVVVSGHSHRPRCEKRNGVFYINPGSAGPRRFTLPISLGKLRIHGRRLDYESRELLARPG